MPPRRLDRRGFFRGACASLAAPLAASLLGRCARGDDGAPPGPPAPEPADPAAPEAKPAEPSLEEFVNRWKPGHLFRNGKSKVVHFLPLREAKIPKEAVRTETIPEGMRLVRAHRHRLLLHLLAKHGGEEPFVRAAARLDPMLPGIAAREIRLLGREKRYGEMLPFLDGLAETLEDRAKEAGERRAAKIGRTAAEIARVRAVVERRAAKAAEKPAPAAPGGTTKK